MFKYFNIKMGDKIRETVCISSTDSCDSDTFYMVTAEETEDLNRQQDHDGKDEQLSTRLANLRDNGGKRPDINLYNTPQFVTDTRPVSPNVRQLRDRHAGRGADLRGHSVIIEEYYPNNNDVSDEILPRKAGKSADESGGICKSARESGSMCNQYEDSSSEEDTTISLHRLRHDSASEAVKYSTTSDDVLDTADSDVEATILLSELGYSVNRREIAAAKKALKIRNLTETFKSYYELGIEEGISRAPKRDHNFQLVKDTLMSDTTPTFPPIKVDQQKLYDNRHVAARTSHVAIAHQTSPRMCNDEMTPQMESEIKSLTNDVSLVEVESCSTNTTLTQGKINKTNN